MKYRFPKQDFYSKTGESTRFVTRPPKIREKTCHCISIPLNDWCSSDCVSIDPFISFFIQYRYSDLRQGKGNGGKDIEREMALIGFIDVLCSSKSLLEQRWTLEVECMILNKHEPGMLTNHSHCPCFPFISSFSSGFHQAIPTIHHSKIRSTK